MWKFLSFSFCMTTRDFSSRKLEILPPSGSPPRLNWISKYLPWMWENHVRPPVGPWDVGVGEGLGMGLRSLASFLLLPMWPHVTSTCFPPPTPHLRPDCLFHQLLLFSPCLSYLLGQECPYLPLWGFQSSLGASALCLAHRSIPFYFFKIFNLLLEREKRRKKEGERNINVRKKHRLVASHMCPNWGPNTQPECVPWLGIEPANFRLMGQCPTHWATPVRAISHFIDQVLSPSIITQRPPCLYGVLLVSRAPQALFLVSDTIWVLLWLEVGGQTSHIMSPFCYVHPRAIQIMSSHYANTCSIWHILILMYSKTTSNKM